jgi:hypothetical protein
MEQSGGTMRRLEMLVALDTHRSFNRAARSSRRAGGGAIRWSAMR